jgi:hypothetical protein
VHVVRRRPELAGRWIGSGPDPSLEERLAELDQIMTILRQAEEFAVLRHSQEPTEADPEFDT